MKILSAKQTQLADAYTIEHKPICSIELMEVASKAFVEKFIQLIDSKHPVAIFAGMGNNGGDGFAIARLLLEKKYTINLYWVQYSKQASDDLLLNKNRLSKLKKSIIHEIDDVKKFSDISSDTVIIDALWGSGLNRAIEGLGKKIIQNINERFKHIIAVDIPSGLFADQHTDSDIVIRAKHTISFQLPKLAFMFPENFKYCGEWHTVNIGLNKTFIRQARSNHLFIGKRYITEILKPKSKFDHKGTYGHACIVGGSYGKMGAIILSAEAALRTGAGLVSVNIPTCGYEIMQESLAEAMVITNKGEKALEIISPEKRADAVGIGPGLGKVATTIKAFKNWLKTTHKPIVIDADAINIIASNEALIKEIPKQSILTPHMKEFERLIGKTKNDFDRNEKQIAFSKKHKLIIVLKGAHTCITSPEGICHFNSTGNQGMATAGSGDVLTGIITSLLAQKYDALDAAIIGVYLHGLAGDCAIKEIHPNSLIASDIIKNISTAFKSLT